MLANVVKIGRAPTRSQVLEGLAFPELPEELLEAEREHAEAKASLAIVSEDLDRLSSDFDNYGLTRVDGSEFPIDGRKGELVRLFRKRAELDSADQAARRALADARRKFGDEVSRRIEPAGAALCEIITEHLMQAEELLDTFKMLIADARKANVTVSHPQLSRAGYHASQLANISRDLQPPAAMRR